MKCWTYLEHGVIFRAGLIGYNLFVRYLSKARYGLQKTTFVKNIAVRENGIFRRKGGLIDGPP